MRDPAATVGIMEARANADAPIADALHDEVFSGNTRRQIRSFVRREGRMTLGQKRALAVSWERYGIDLVPGGILEPFVLFGRHAPLTLEIGFGNGESLAAQALAQPERDFIGIEVHRPGVGHLLRIATRQGCANLRVISADAVTVLQHNLPIGCLDRVQIFFPDPWPKKRHHKRRLVQPEFLMQLARAVRVGGRLCLATDWEDYAQHMYAVLAGLLPVWTPDGPQPLPARPEYRLPTRFEMRGNRLGHRTRDFVYVRCEDPLHRNEYPVP